MTFCRFFSQQETFYANIFIYIWPMNAKTSSAYAEVCSLCWRASSKTRIPANRNRDRSAIVKINTERVIRYINMNCFRCSYLHRCRSRPKHAVTPLDAHEKVVQFLVALSGCTRDFPQREYLGQAKASHSFGHGQHAYVVVQHNRRSKSKTDTGQYEVLLA